MIWGLVQILCSLFTISSSSPCLHLILTNMFLNARKNMVCQNQVETQLSWTESEKGTENLNKPQIITKRWLPKKKHKKAHREGLFLAIVVFSVTLCARFSLTVHVFNSIVQFFGHFFACLRFCANKQKKWLKRWTIGIKMCTVEKKWEQIVSENTTIARNSPSLCAFLCFF